MFSNFNTDSIHIKKVYSATVSENDIGKRLYLFGETKIYQLAIKFKGRTDVSYNNKKYIFDDNSVIYYPCESRNDIPYNKVFRRPGTGVVIFFTSEHPLETEAKLYKFNSTAIAKAFKEILYEYQNNNLLKAKSTFYKILALVDENEEQKYKNPFSDVLKQINNNINKPDISLIEASLQLGYSADYFRHKFNKEVGMSPKKYITSLKIQSAKDLLLNSNFNIQQISNEMGFHDYNYFSRFFKKETGYTPSQFRKKYKKYF